MQFSSQSSTSDQGLVLHWPRSLDRQRTARYNTMLSFARPSGALSLAHMTCALSGRLNPDALQLSAERRDWERAENRQLYITVLLLPLLERRRESGKRIARGYQKETKPRKRKNPKVTVTAWAEIRLMFEVDEETCSIYSWLRGKWALCQSSQTETQSKQTKGLLTGLVLLSFGWTVCMEASGPPWRVTILLSVPRTSAMDTFETSREFSEVLSSRMATNIW